MPFTSSLVSSELTFQLNFKMPMMVTVLLIGNAKENVLTSNIYNEGYQPH